MTILITGGTGRTGAALASHLLGAKVPYLVLTRRETLSGPHKNSACQFDITDPNSYSKPFEKAKTPLEAIYLVVEMTVPNTAERYIDFVRFAQKRGVRRFILLSSNVFHPTSRRPDAIRILGHVHQYLIDAAEHGELHYNILRPTWYMGGSDSRSFNLAWLLTFTDNFSKVYADSIKTQGVVTSASADGPARWISTEDVAEAAFSVINDPTLKNSEHILLGPELLNYDQVWQKTPVLPNND
jgi:uncharacterized protein YbjT (DUF2867 family)